MDTFPSSPSAARRGDSAAQRGALDGPPPTLTALPQAILQDPDGGHSSDEIAWFVDPSGNSMLIDPLSHEDLRATPDFLLALRGTLTTSLLSWRISDHYALWSSLTGRPT